MLQLNVSFGIYAILPQGWLFMFVIILIECLGLSYFFSKKWKDKRLYRTAIISNIVSGIIGFIGSIALNGGWWLVIWFPWVSNHEVGPIKSNKQFLIYYLIAFVLTLIIEGIVNFLMLKNQYSKSKIIKATIIINFMSYLIGSLAMYTYSFS